LERYWPMSLIFKKPLRRVFVGHRGVGKTQLLMRHQQYFSEIKHFDLDAEIEKYIEMPVSQFFKEKGEATFREAENLVYNKITQMNSEYVIALGAGFNPNNILPQDEVIFVTRVTDQDGRIFLNRPRLEPELGPLEEYKKRFHQREPNFLKRADFIYRMPEGISVEKCEVEQKILTFNFRITNAVHTLRAGEIKQIEQLSTLFENIELRNDLLSSQQIQNLLVKYPEKKWLVSIRNKDPLDTRNVKYLDCDVKFASGYKPTILSSHEDVIQKAMQQLQQASQEKQVHLKLCPLVQNFEDLKAGYEWQQEDPENRSFLPRSNTGRWGWYRQLAKHLQKINFVKSSQEIADQPSLYDWLSLPEARPSSWAAVLGEPVYFSRSPLEHQNYFSKKKSYFLKIELSNSELSQNILFLNTLGLTYAAVTSPLKEQLFKIADVKSEVAEKFQAANTLFIKDRQIYVHNTDLEGFQEIVKHIQASEVAAIWGGGGTLEMMKSVLPKALLYSSQTAELRHKLENGIEPIIDYLIWAAPRTPTTKMPKDALTVKNVIDLNYADSSMGLEFAAIRKIGYTSGLTMFKVQALKQQQYWSSKEES
jgi:shikimate kinase